MKIEKCNDLPTFVEQIQTCLNADTNEWQGLKVSFGTDQINLENITHFLDNNKEILESMKNNDNSKTEYLVNFKERIKSEFDYKEVSKIPLLSEFLFGLPPQLPPEALSHILSFSRHGDGAYRTFAAVAQASKELNALSKQALCDWINKKKLAIGNLFGCNTLDQAVSFIQGYGADLTHLDLAFFEGLNSLQFEKVIRSCPRLETIILSNATITNEDVKSICKLDCKRIELLQCRGFTKLPNQLPANLEVLNLTLCNEVTELPDELPKNLKVLKLIHCDWLSKLPPLPKGLVDLSLIGCSGLLILSETNLEKLIGNLANLFSESLKTFQMYGINHNLLYDALDEIKKIYPKVKIKDSF